MVAGEISFGNDFFVVPLLKVPVIGLRCKQRIKTGNLRSLGSLKVIESFNELGKCG